MFYILTISLTITAMVINFIILYRVSKEIKRRELNKKNKTLVELSYQREKLEDELYDLSQKVISNPDLFKEVNHFMISSSDRELVLKQTIADFSFFEEMGFDFTKIKIIENQVMCLMPFHKRYDKIYGALQNACEKCGYTAIRSDNQFQPGDILKYTIELILKSQIIIAVIDGRNPNVFYEIGIAQSIGKSVILISSNSNFQTVPFDIRNNRMVLYKTENELESNLEKCLYTIKREKK